MYKLSRGKCVVCFLFLVMVAFLSCSGFRIDSDTERAATVAAAMHASAGGGGGGDGVRFVPSDSATSSVRTQRAHRIRHSKHSRRHQHPVSSTRTPPLQQSAQIPAYSKPPEPTAMLLLSSSSAKRAQRSPLHRKHQQQQQQEGKRAKPCQEQDIARKAYAANTVVLAKAESMSLNRVRNYSVSFRILRRYKAPENAYADEILRLTFMNDTRRMHCESEVRDGGGGGGIVKAQIKQSKEYYLFLNAAGNHNYTVVGAPVLNRRKRRADIEKVLANVTRRDFVPRLKKPELIREQYEAEKKIRLVCKAKGYPIPVIEWKKNETVLHSNQNIRITYRGEDFLDRRKSTLVIRNAEEKDSGRYTCVARGVGGDVSENSTELRISNKEKCQNDLFCLNGGNCKYDADLHEHYCLCADDYSGARCDQKTIGELPQSSYMYEDD